MTFVDELNKRDDGGVEETYALKGLSGRVMKAIMRACEDNRQQQKICEYYNYETRSLLPYNQNRLKEFLQNDIRKLGFTDFKVNLLPSEETEQKGTNIFGKPKLKKQEGLDLKYMLH